MTKRQEVENDEQRDNPLNGNTLVTRVDYAREPAASAYKLDIEKACRLFDTEFTSVGELFSTRTVLPDGQVISAPTHMMGQSAESLRLIAYDDSWGARQRDAARFYAPGEVAIAIKHHSPHPDEKERMKLQCTHIQIVVGVDTKNGPGVITINNPQSYEASPFGSATYPMIFIKPVFPKDVPIDIQRAYVNNMRTWLMIANAFTNFPGNYNGGDPLATRSVSQVKDLGNKLLEALAGDAAAIRWLGEDENKVYCAELAHVALNLGIHYPLNEKHMGQEFLGTLTKQIETREFLADNENPYAALVALETAPPELQPIANLLGLTVTEPHDEDPFGDGLAIEPFTLADILENFIKETIPRDLLGEDVAPIQAALLEKAEPELLQVTGMEQLPEEDPKRQALTALYTSLIAAVGQKYTDYTAFREAIYPLITQARQLASPRRNGAGAFVPPHCFLIRASDSIEGKRSQGIFGWQYIGHGMHESILEVE